IPWLFRRFAGMSPEAAAAGWPGGVPPVETPDGTYMWDTTAMIHHLERHFPGYVIEDAADEWVYRTAVGSRWYCPENSAVGGFELARDVAARMPLTCD